jgi:predicted alpha/beta hydrolase family esterase
MYLTLCTYEDYLSYLKGREISIENFKPRKDWKNGLEKELGNGFEVLLPSMPNKANARYEEWKIWFERMMPFLDDRVIFVGHSLGGTFLAKYFSENIFPKKIKAVLLVAAPFDEESGREALVGFSLPLSMEKFIAQAGEIYLFYSRDDPVVSFGELNKYRKVLLNAKTLVFKDKQHFNQEIFPEIVNLIRQL